MMVVFNRHKHTHQHPSNELTTTHTYSTVLKGFAISTQCFTFSSLNLNSTRSFSPTSGLWDCDGPFHPRLYSYFMSNYLFALPQRSPWLKVERGQIASSVPFENPKLFIGNRHGTQIHKTSSHKAFLYLYSLSSGPPKASHAGEPIRCLFWQRCMQGMRDFQRSCHRTLGSSDGMISENEEGSGSAVICQQI